MGETAEERVYRRLRQHYSQGIYASCQERESEVWCDKRLVELMGLGEFEERVLVSLSQRHTLVKFNKFNFKF
tara:strand:- start:262 stop:477 length:216 start_codon:yes stop_codon:yes gene_type:complete